MTGADRLRGLKRIPPIKSLMTPFPYSIEPQAPVSRAKAMMAEHGFRHLPVRDGEALVGVVSDRDIELALDPARGLPPEAVLRVEDVAAEAYTVDLSAPADRVLLEMAERHTGSALVTRRGRLVGIFTVTDACRWFGEYLRALFPPGGGTDAA